MDGPRSGAGMTMQTSAPTVEKSTDPMKTLKLTFQGVEIGTIEIKESALLDILTASSVIGKPPTASMDVKNIENYEHAKVMDLAFAGHVYEKF
jgi:hypothetical protein